jgi:3-oxoacyl-[acyl-carrier protein] reductase
MEPNSEAGLSNPFDMKGKTVWVTGSGSGIGKAIAELLAHCGADLVLHGLDQRSVTEPMQRRFQEWGRRICVVDGDLTRPETCSAMAEQIRQELGGLSGLVNCAGGSPNKSFISQMSPDDWDNIIAKNLKSVFLTTRAVLPLLREAAIAKLGPSVVNVSSTVTRTGGVAGGACYVTAKGGVEAFTRALAKELARDGIRVNAVAPGLIDTPFHGRDVKEAYAGKIGTIPLGRVGEPQDLAGPVLFLASDAASYVTGEIIEVSGGTRLTP